MSPQPAEAPSENLKEIISEATVWLQSASEECRFMQLTERTLMNVTRSEIRSEPEPYDQTRLLEARELLDEAIYELDATKCLSAREQIANEMFRWQLHIAQYDAAITAEHLRRFCETYKHLLDALALPALLRFYRSRSRILQSQSKYDFVATRMFTLNTPDNLRKLRFTREQTRVHLSRMFTVWGSSAEIVLPEPEEVTRVAAQFDAYVNEVKTYSSLKDLLASRVFNRAREFKSNLSGAFFTPEVTATAIEYNVVSFNVFANLLDSEGRPFTEIPDYCREFAISFSNPASFPQEQENHFAPEAPENRADSIEFAFLDDAETEPQVPPSTNKVIAAPSPREARPAPVAPNKVPDNIEERGENRVLIALYRQASSAMQSLDLKMFLGSPGEAESLSVAWDEILEVRRRALALILSADHLMHLQGENDEESEADRAGRTTSARDEIAEIRPILEQLIQQYPQPEQLLVRQNLAYVLEKLDETDELLLKGVRTRERKRAAQEQKQAAATQQAEAPKSGVTAFIAWFVAQLRQAAMRYKWLLAATALLAVIGLVLNMSQREDETPLTQLDPEIVVIDPATLPEGLLLKSATKRQDILVAIVAEGWNGLTEEQRRQKLQLWFNHSKETGVQMFTLIDQRGMPAGSATDDGVTVENSPQE